MMRYWGAIFFSILFVAQLLWPLFPYVEYSLNKTHIVKVFCVNKKDTRCKGQCYLNKQIKKQFKQDHKPSKNSPKPNTFKEIIAYLDNGQNSKTIHIFTLLNINFGYTRLISSIAYTQPLTQPPELLIF